MNKSASEKVLYLFLKRIFDIIVSLVAIVLLSPLFIGITVFLKAQGDGPIIFKQERLGRDEKIFKIFKFRSMTLSAPNLAAKDIDEKTYVTPFGKFLRKTSLDELPQLINILKGDMSFVGPRPLISNEGYITERRREYGIYAMRPGLSGWAQVKARNTENQDEKLRLDVYYKEHCSFFFDLKIILMTLFQKNPGS